MTTRKQQGKGIQFIPANVAAWFLNWNGSRSYIHYTAAKSSQTRCATGWPHQIPKKNILRKYIYLQGEDMPVACHATCRSNPYLASIKRNCFLFRTASLEQGGKVSRRRQEQRDKVAENGMADCSTLLKRITRLKCVNSQVRSSRFSHKGVLSNGLMAACRGHHGDHTRQELDHLSDPMGTDSLQIATKQESWS